MPACLTAARLIPSCWLPRPASGSVARREYRRYTRAMRQLLGLSALVVLLTSGGARAQCAEGEEIGFHNVNSAHLNHIVFDAWPTGHPAGVWWIPLAASNIGRLEVNGEEVQVEIVDTFASVTGIRVPETIGPNDAVVIFHAVEPYAFNLSVDEEALTSAHPPALSLERVLAYNYQPGDRCADLAESNAIYEYDYYPRVRTEWLLAGEPYPYTDIQDPPEYLLNVWLSQDDDMDGDVTPSDRVLGLSDPRQIFALDGRPELRVVLEGAGSWRLSLQLVDFETGATGPIESVIVSGRAPFSVDDEQGSDFLALSGCSAARQSDWAVLPFVALLLLGQRFRRGGLASKFGVGVRR